MAETVTAKTQRSFWARRGTSVAWLLAMALSLPALRVGLFGDDLLQRLALEGAPLTLPLGPASLYSFTDTTPMSQLIAKGYLPWQTHPDTAVRFFRPLSSLSITLDQALFGRAALPGHLVSLAWFMALIAVAIALFSRLLSPSRAGLAAVLYAAAGAHTTNLAWVASRQMLIAGVFSGLSIWLHLSAREPKSGKQAIYGWAAPLALMVALLSGEASLGAVAFIASYELFGRNEALRRRLAAAAPAVAMGLLYLVLYNLFGFGTKHSGLYASPFNQPLAFAKAIAERLPVLLGDLAGAIPSALWGPVPESHPGLITLGLLFATVVASLLIFAPLTSAERRQMRWMAIAAVVSTIPLVGGVLDGRLLVIPMFSSAALLATAIEANWNAARVSWRRLVVRTTLSGLLLLHIGVGGLVRVAFTEALVEAGRSQKRLATSLDASACEPGATGLILTGSDPSMSLYGLVSIAFYRPELLRRIPYLYVLSLAPHDQRLESSGPRSFTLKVEDLPRHTHIFEQFFTDEAFHMGQIVELGTLKAEVLTVEAGLPTQVRFDVPAQSCLLFLRRQRLVSRPLPLPGQGLSIPYEKGPMGL